MQPTWQTPDGSIRLFLGDCRDVMPTLEAGSIDAIIADLPYGTTACKWDTVIPFDDLWSNYKRLVKRNAAIVLCGTEPFSSYLRASNMAMFRYDWYWQKDKGANFLFGNKQPLKVIETASVFYAAQPTYNPQKIVNPKGPSRRHLSRNPSKITRNVKEVMGESWKPTVMDETENYHGANYEPDKLLPKQLVYFARDARRVHPTQKPVALMEYLTLTYTNEGETVLDNTMGSGTQAIACLNTGRRFIGIEKDPDIFATAQSRIEAELAKQPLLEGVA